LDGAVSQEEFDRLEEFYRSRSESVRVETCPLADASLIEQFGKHHYRVTEFTNVMARTVGDGNVAGERRAVSSGVTVERAGKENIDLWTLTVSQGFPGDFPLTQGIPEVMQAFATAAHVECYLARWNGEVAGGGTVIIRDGIAGLFGASTLPACRNRGVQTALLEARVARAAEMGL
jgi:ribosomal protein S18 acetylase RimI-like enzyme